MKQLSLNNILDSLRDEPATIGDRLNQLGVDAKVKKNFSSEVLAANVYGTSFLKFLQENRSKLGIVDEIPAEKLPDNFVDAFDSGEETLERRLVASGFSKQDAQEMFNDDALGLYLSGDEFQDFLEKNRNTFIGGIKKLAGVGGADA